MTARERALSIFRYQPTHIPCFDLQEGTVWDSIGYYFRQEHGLNTGEDVLDFLGCDFRWSHLFNKNAVLPRSDIEVRGLAGTNYSDSSGGYPLAGAESVADIDRLFDPNPENIVMPDFKAMRDMYPDKALVFCIPWTPFFSGACSLFGMEQAMITMLTEPEIYHAFAIKQKEYLCEYIRLGIKAGAAEYCDFFWTGDDFASETGLILSPADWRRLVKPYLKEAFDIAKSAGMYTLFHSCGSVVDVYPDFIEIGIDSHIGVQTSARGMEIETLARGFGGKLIIFGGVDAQTTLVKETSDGVMAQVQKNISAFENCGGYIVSNSHHGLPDLPGENIYAMARAAGRTTYA